MRKDSANTNASPQVTAPDSPAASSAPAAANGTANGPSTAATSTPPAIALPKGGGAIRGIGEKFAANPVTGTGNLTVPLPASPARSDFGPKLQLSYDSGSGNGPFGIGWSLSLPSVTRKTDKGLPQYLDNADESDVFVISGAEDLVPVLEETPGGWVRSTRSCVQSTQTSSCTNGKSGRSPVSTSRVTGLLTTLRNAPSVVSVSNSD